MTITQNFVTEDSKSFPTLELAQQHEDDLLLKNAPLNKYLQTSEGQRLVEKHDLQSHGTWSIKAEDPNRDFGGHHHEPELAVVCGKLEDVINYATSLPRFYTWGAGGRITKLDVIQLDATQPMETK